MNQNIIDARRKAQEAANNGQRIVDWQIDDMRILQRSGWKDVEAMKRISESIPHLESARVAYEALMSEYYEAGGLEPILVYSRHRD